LTCPRPAHHHAPAIMDRGLELDELTAELAAALRTLEGMPVQGPCYCKPCDMWLNGAGQYLDHAAGRKHRRRLGAQRVAQPQAPAEDPVASGDAKDGTLPAGS
jgi:hypothetical protein